MKKEITRRLLELLEHKDKEIEEWQTKATAEYMKRFGKPIVGEEFLKRMKTEQERIREDLVRKVASEMESPSRHWTGSEM